MQHENCKRVIRSAFAGVVLLGSAQGVFAGAPPTSAPATQPTVLDTLGNDQLMSELAARGIDNLLDRYFDVNHVPEARRQAVRSLTVLGELTNPNSKLTPGDRVRLSRQLADNVDLILSGVKDPQKLAALSAALIDNAANREANTLEYWGQSPGARTRLKPVASAIYKLLGKASELATAQADVLATQIKGVDDPKADQWVKLDEIGRSSKYQQNMSAYFVVLSADADDPARRKIADDATAYLEQFDNPDSGVQARVRNMKGKLSLARGAYKEARRFFATVAKDKGQIKPPPNPIEHFEARYFSGVADIVSRDLPASQQDLKDLEAWEKDEFPKLLADAKLDAKAAEETTQGTDAATRMLHYRVILLESELAKTPDEKKKAESAAEGVLLQLRKDRPEFASAIDEQLVALLPADRPIPQLNTLMLQGLMSKGAMELKKTDPDAKVLERAIAAAHELLSRREKDKEVTPQIAAQATILIPTLLDRSGHPVDAANGYLDYASHFQTIEPKSATEAIDRAGYLVFEMKKQQRAPEGFTELYGRFLQTAIAEPFNHKELAYLMGEHLQGQGKDAQALPFYQQVPRESPSYLNAQYKQMLCLRGLLDGNLSPVQHKMYVQQLIDAAGTVKKLGAESKNEIDRAKAVQSTLVYARLARTEQKDPKTSLATLADFDSLVKGLPGEKGLQSEALFERVQAQMDLGQFSEATGLLVNLLNKTEGIEGMSLVRQLLEQLDEQYQKADVIHDESAMRTIMHNEAQLTGFLGNWAKDNKDPNIKKFYYAYSVYDARTQRLAASMTEDPADRKKRLEQSLKLYQSLQSPAMHDLYAKTLDPKKVASGDIDPKDADPSVQVGLAFTEFELGDYKDAQATLGDLLGSQKLGPPMLVDNSSGGAKSRVNDLYWEATYKLLKCNAELATAANDNAVLANTQRGLKNILIRGGIPPRWQDEFESLRKQIAPDFSVK